MVKVGAGQSGEVDTDEKVSKSGSVPECVTELLKELCPLYRHIPHIQF